MSSVTSCVKFWARRFLASGGLELGVFGAVQGAQGSSSLKGYFKGYNRGLIKGPS